MEGFEGRELLFRTFSDGEMSPPFMLGAIPMAYEKQKGVVVMQYTGRKDKNGKRIFEGDIVRWDKVIYNAAMTESVTQVVKSGVFGFSDGGPSAVVIGNVFEHPHLLQGVE